MPLLPTGVVANATNDFTIAQPTPNPPAPALFIFATGNGATTPGIQRSLDGLSSTILAGS